MATQSKFFADLGIKSATHTEVDGNLTIAGNLTVQGTQTTIDSTTKSVADSMIELASGNTSSDIKDIGIYGNYDDGLSDGGASEYTGLFRDASDSTWKLYDGLEVEPTTTVNTSGTGYTLADLQVGDLTATTLTATNGLTGSSITYPTSDGSSGQVIKTNGSGTLSFGNATLDSLSDCTISSATPSATTNPPYAGAMWIEEDTGDVYVCTNATTNNNTWVKTGSADGITTSGSNTIIQSPDDTNVIHVNNSAQVGIGVTDSDAKLEIKGSGGGTGLTFKTTDASSNEGFYVQDGGRAGLNYYPFTIGIPSGTAAASGARFQVEEAGFLTVLNTGNVGIGTNSPTTKLDVRGTSSLIGDVGIEGNVSMMSNVVYASQVYVHDRFGHLGDVDTFMDFADDQIKLSAGGERVKIESSGIYVYPATSGDDFGFHVKTANTADTGMVIGRSGTGNAEMGIKVSSQGSNSFASFKFAISDAVSYSSDDWFKLKVSGEMDGNFNDTSDQNLKENIVSIADGDLAKILQLNPVTFDWKNAVSRNDQTGFIAQEVETIFPNEVLGDAYDVEVEGSGKSINTIGLLSHTVKAMQEMKTLIDTLEARIVTLES